MVSVTATTGDTGRVALGQALPRVPQPPRLRRGRDAEALQAGSWPGPNQALWLQTVTFSTPTQVCSGTAVWPTAETMTIPVYAAPPSGRRPAGRSRGPPGAPAPSWRTAVSSGAPHQPEKGAVSESAFGPRGTPWRKPVGPLLTGVLGHRGRLGRAPQMSLARKGCVGLRWGAQAGSRTLAPAALPWL